MTDYTRLTIQSLSRKADLVLPGDVPVATLLPDVLELLGDEHLLSSRPVALVTTVGYQLDPARSLTEQHLPHGSVLRLVRVDQAPPPPDIADVTDVVADATESRSDLWAPKWSVIAASIICAVLGVAAGLLAARGLDASWPPLAWVVAGLALLAIVFARRGPTPCACLIASAAAGLALPMTNLIAGTNLGTLVWWLGIGCVLLALVGGLGFADAGLGLGGGVGAVLVAGSVVGDAAGWRAIDTLAVVSVCGVLIVGLLPGIAMTVSGLTGLDDRILQGKAVPRSLVHQAVDTTHRALTTAAMLSAVIVGGCAWQLAATPSPWAKAMAAALGVIMLLRILVFPLVAQRLALLAAGSAPLISLLLGFGAQAPVVAIAIAGALICAAVALFALPISRYVGARLRRLASILELLAVVALVPLTLALLGVFADLMEAFR